MEKQKLNYVKCVSYWTKKCNNKYPTWVRYRTEMTVGENGSSGISAYCSVSQLQRK